ncbi:unnamed protein product [Oikopleura dioica]|uniref:Uncharacterized protein n=1 Tax=Oikopleura dioica TaxID=34765 RepID=E4Z5C5_OIKDI|nr:unnamed protein product [Oikopleura dioica]
MRITFLLFFVGTLGQAPLFRSLQQALIELGATEPTEPTTIERRSVDGMKFADYVDDCLNRAFSFSAASTGNSVLSL